MLVSSKTESALTRVYPAVVRMVCESAPLHAADVMSTCVVRLIDTRGVLKMLQRWKRGDVIDDRRAPRCRDDEEAGR